MNFDPADLGAELTRNSFRAWLGPDAEAALDRLVARGVVVSWTPTAGMEELFREFAVEVTDGHQGAAELVRTLVGVEGTTRVQLLLDGGVPRGLFPGIATTEPITRFASAGCRCFSWDSSCSSVLLALVPRPKRRI